jgi:hypothetical protein
MSAKTPAKSLGAAPFKGVTERAAGNPDSAVRLDPAPRWQLVDDETVVGRKPVERSVVPPIRLVAARVARHQVVVPPLHHGGWAAVVVGKRERQRRREQPNLQSRQSGPCTGCAPAPASSDSRW